MPERAKQYKGPKPQRQQPPKKEYHKVYSDNKQWRKARAAYLAKPENLLCRLCGAPATEIDHIIPWKGNWKLFWDEANNWQPLCRVCHGKKSSSESMEATGKRYVVCGAPGSGKTTWVSQRRLPNDLVWDYDDIGQSLFGCDKTPPLRYYPIMDSILQVVINAAMTHDGSVYIIATNKDRCLQYANRLKAELVIMPTTKDECQQRILQEIKTDRSDRLRSIDDWFIRWG